MPNDTTVLRYTYLGDAPVPELVAAIALELNEGLAFARHEYGEERVRTAVTGAEHWDVDVETGAGSTIIVTARDSAFQGPTLTELFTVFWSNLQDFGPLRLEDLNPSRWLSSSLTPRRGRPALGLPGLRQLLGLAAHRSLLGTILKPSRLMTLAERREQAILFASCGLNLIKEDETYLPSNETVLHEAAEIQFHLAGYPALYVPNVSACRLDHEFVAALGYAGVRVVLVNVLHCGWSWLTRLMEIAPDLGLWIHRVGYENVASTLGLRAWLRVLRLAGVDLAHIGTPWLHPPSELEEAQQSISLLHGRDADRPAVVPVLTKTTAATVPRLIAHLGVDVCLMTCGAVRQAGQVHQPLVNSWVAAARDAEEHR